jgi:hypothetical protein
MESESRTAFQGLVGLLDEISREWIGPERGVSGADHDALAHEALATVLSGASGFYLTEDFRHPEFSVVSSPRRKWSDNPDAHLLIAPILGDGVYRIRGKRAGEVYLSFTIHKGDRDGHWPKGVPATLNDTEMQFEPDGSFEIVLSHERVPGNWMPLDPDAGTILVRWYFQNDRPAACDPTINPELTIAREDKAEPPRGHATDEDIARRLNRVTNWVRSKYGFQILPPGGGQRPQWFSSVPNTLGQPEAWGSEESGGGWGPVDVAYSAGPYKLANEEALLMEGRLPRGVFSNVVLWNPIGRTEDYRERRVSLNAKQIEMSSDRRFQIVVAHEDPGIANWLDTAGYESGTIYWRHMLPAEAADVATCRVVPFDQLKKRLAG